MEERSRWSSKLIFILAAVGSAVGLGNVWRFPYLAGKYGGGAFLIPYVIMLLVIGIPMLMMEFAIGQKMQQGAVGSFKNIQRKLSGIGLAAVLCGFVVTCYYAVVIAWSVLYTFFAGTLAWGDKPKEFFFNEVLSISEGVSQVGTISVPIIFALVVVWLMVYFSIWKGVKSVGNVVLITMPLPVILLLAILIRGVTLPGSMTGILYYVKPNFAALLDLEVWQAAMSQIFFTLTLAFGAMIAYASFQHEKSDISKSAMITALINSALSIISGFAVFATLGYMSTQSGTPVSELAASGPSLAFIVFPQALSMVPMAPLFAVAFFIMLITLGIDSAFSLVEAVTTTFHDKYPEIRREDLSMYVCVAGFICGIIFCSSAGLYYLDITDHFITNYGLVGVGLLEALAVGWVYKAENLRQYINEVSDIKIGRWWNVFIKYLIPLGLTALLINGLYTDIKTPYEGYPLWALAVFGWGMLGVLFLVSYLFAHFAKE